MEYDLTQIVPVSAIGFMGFAIIAMPVIQVFVYMFICHAYPEDHKGLFLGLASYFIICNVIISLVYLAEQYIGNIIIQDMTNEAVVTALSNVGQIISLIIECSIIVYCMEFSYRKFCYQPGVSRMGSALAFGLGYTLVDAVYWLMSVVTNWIMALSINGVGLSAYAEVLTDEEMEAFMESIESLLSNSGFYYLMLFLERIIFAAFVISIMSMIVLVSKGILKKTFLVNIMGIYFLYYVPALLRNMGLISGNFITLVISIVITVFVCMFSWQIMAKTSPEDADYLRDVKKRGIIVTIFNLDRKKEKKEKKGKKKEEQKPSDISKNANMKTK